MSPQRKIEIQSDSLLEIVRYAARVAAKKAHSPVLVEDSGLFVRALNGFPGPYSSYVHKTIGCEGILKLLSGIDDRYAFFDCAIAFCTPSEDLYTFQGRSIGQISINVRGTGGFGFDPIFIPNGESLTFAEMLPEQKDRFSHRGIAFRAFGSWFSSKSIAKP